MNAISVACFVVACSAGVLAQADPSVRLLVSVREGSRPVTGLSADDFVLTDNEVPQSVQLASAEAVSLDLTLVVDTKTSAANVTERFGKNLQQLGRSLRKGDALRVIGVDSFVQELRPMSPPAEQKTATLASPQPSLSSLHDAMVAALVRPPARDRLHLVVAVTDGADTMSVTSADRVREVAARADARLDIVTVRPVSTANAAWAAVRPRFRDANLLILTEAAEQTGGELRPPGLFGDLDLVTAVMRAVDEVRQSYLLSYTPDGVERAGWHDVNLTVPRAPGAVVRARRGYHAN